MSGDKFIVLKLVLLGDTAVGKTSLIDMYAHHRFKEDYKPTLGVNIVVKEIDTKSWFIVFFNYDINTKSWCQFL